MLFKHCLIFLPEYSLFKKIDLLPLCLIILIINMKLSTKLLIANNHNTVLMYILTKKNLPK